MFNQFKTDSATRGGRRPRPTLKVKRMLADSIATDLKKLSLNLNQQEGDIRRAMNQHLMASKVHGFYSRWCDVYDEFERTEQDFRTYLSEDELAVHDRILESKRHLFEQLKEDVSDYLANAARRSGHVTTQKSFLEETKRLEKEIQAISVRLNKAKLSIASGDQSLSDFQDDSPPGFYDSIEAPRYKSTPVSLFGDGESVEELIPFCHPLVGEDPALKWQATLVDKARQGAKKEQAEAGVAEEGTLQKLVTLMERKKDRLPQLEPEMFSGAMLQYPLWIRSFEMLIEKNTASVSERLFYLGKYTSGEARESIAGFLCLFSEDAYERAKSVLQARYGDKVQVAQAYKKKLSSWSPVKKGDGIALRKLADFTWQCSAAMESVKNLRSLDSAESVSKIVKLLPSYLMERWDRVVDKHYYSSYTDPRYSFETAEGDYPPFVEFCKFLSQEARILNGPGRMLRGETQDSSGDAAASNKLSRRIQSLATKAHEDQSSKQKKGRALNCYYCNEPHVVSKCTQFLSKPSEEKRQFALAESLCFGCLSKTHAYKDCHAKKPWLLKDASAEKPAKVLSTRLETDGEDGIYYTLLVPVEVVYAENPLVAMKCYALLDTQADGCFVSTKLAKKLQVPENTVQLELITMGNKQVVETTLVNQLKVRGLSETKVVTVKKAYTRDEIPADSQAIPRLADLRQWEHLRPVVQAFPEDDTDMQVEMLIGCNYPGVFVPHDCAYESDDKPYGVRTKLGWGIMGRRGDGNSATTCFCTAMKEVPLAMVNRAFDFDFQGDADDTKRTSQEDLAFLDVAKRSLRQDADGHFEMELPLRDEEMMMPNNRDVALRQLLGQKKRFVRDAEYLQQYNACFQEMLSKGYAEVAPTEYDEGKASFTPHHAVSHPRKPGVLRVVSNFSSQKNGISLNQNLMAGPDLTGNLVGLMCRFREERVAFMCDIKKMFHQVKVAEKHRDYLRFLWFEGGDPEGKIIEYRMCVFPFGATSSPSCANYAFKATAEKYGHEFDAEVAVFVKRDFYVDDGLKSKATVSEVVRLFLQAHELCKLGKFYLCKFTSNSEEAVKAVPQELLATNVRESVLTEHALPIETSLGLKWDMSKDSFMFVVKQLIRKLTRRGMLSALASIYDPIGLISPIVLVGRLILQELCRRGAEWDDPLPEEIEKRWCTWFEELAEINGLRIPRCFKSEQQGKIVEVQIHHFCDASTLGYGCCSYVRLKDESGEIAVTLVTAKARVGPKKAVTMPRLELQAAVLATKQSLFLKDELPYSQVEQHFWSDSQVVLGYVTNFTRRFQLYVANRVAYIRENSDASVWRYVRSEHNPADLASRGTTVQELTDSKLWWHGPEYLKSDEWRDQMDKFNIDDNDPELKKEQVVVHVTKAKRSYCVTDCLADCSSWYKMVTYVVIWRQYLRKLQEKAYFARLENTLSPWMSKSSPVKQRVDAEQCLIQVMQREEFATELHLFRLVADRVESREAEHNNKLILKQSSSLYRLDPFMDEHGSLRVGGRLKYSPLPSQLTQPLIVPEKNQLTKALVLHYHQIAQHPGRQATLAQIRGAGLWLIHGRSVVERATRDCTICKKIRGAPLVQKIADLPTERLQEVAPFTYCGMDLFGPFQIKERRSMLKRWICVFICFNTLAVHLEVVYEISTDSFLNAFRRFVGRRGPVRTLFSDRGTNFTGAANELRGALEELDYKKMHAELLSQKCDLVEFRFNSPKASHMGGLWERAIRSLRSVLSAILIQHGSRLNDESFHTFIVETEAISNSKPLSTLDLSDPSSEMPLTPARLLTMKGRTALPPPGTFLDKEVYGHRRWRQVQALSDAFWKQWRAELLPTFQARRKWLEEKRDLAVDDVVVLMDESVPRGQWPLARVEKLIVSHDGLVRRVEVKCHDSTLERPICKLIYLCSAEK